MLLKEVVAVNTDRAEVFKVFFALVLANKASTLAKEMVPREGQAAVSDSQAQDFLRWLDSYRSMGPDSL